MRIGDLAKAADVSAQTIRFYEREGLLPEAARATNGYRRYDGETAGRLVFIRRCAEVGFSLREIRTLIGMENHACGEVADLLDVKLMDLKRRISRMRQVKRSLEDLRAKCAETGDSECGALRVISEGRR